MRLSFVSFLLIAELAVAQAWQAGPQVSTFFSSIDDTDQPYGLYLPRGYDPATKYPLVISLHDSYSNHRLNLRRVFGKGNLPGESNAEATRYFPGFPDVPFIVASPLARGTLGYQGLPEQDVYDVLADVRKRFSIDDDRVYLTGLAMGGGGALWLGLTRPDLWAAIAAVCPAPTEGTVTLAQNALNIPIHLFHGAADPVVPVAVSREWRQRLEELGGSVEYTEYPTVRHNSWDNAYRNAAIFAWFGQFKRNRYPDRVRFVTDRYKYRDAYWIGIDALAPGVSASIDARFTGANTIDVTAASLDAFHLDVAQHPKYSAQSPLRLSINGKRVAVGRGPLAFALANGVWKQGPYRSAAFEKGPGLEGPVMDALSQHQVYVYGTAGSPSEEELAARRDLAMRGAEWGSARQRLLLSFRVISDRELRPADFDAGTVVLFGTRETNSVIADLAPRLPIALNAGAADYGLVYVYPNGKNYVVINSGLPFWTGVDFIRGLEPRYLPPAFLLLAKMRDYVLFRGSMEHVIVNGRFDRYWKMPAEDAEKLQTSGAVAVSR